MYTKNELEEMDTPQLMEIANNLGVKVSQNDELETVIYAILDKAAEDSAANGGTTKRKRTRIAKKDNNKVYTVNGTDGENLDANATKKTKEKKPSLDSLFAEADAAEAKQQEKQDVEAPIEEPIEESLLPRSVVASRRRNWKRLLPVKPLRRLPRLRLRHRLLR